MSWPLPPGDRALFSDLPADRFPFAVVLLDAATGEEVWRAVCTGPGVLDVPGRADTNRGRPVRVRLDWPDGTSTEVDPPERGPGA